jgi:hypothetical protein
MRTQLLLKDLPIISPKQKGRVPVRGMTGRGRGEYEGFAEGAVAGTGGARTGCEMHEVCKALKSGLVPICGVHEEVKRMKDEAVAHVPYILA